MAIATINVTGKVVGPDAQGVGGGIIEVRPDGVYTVEDNGTTQVVSGMVEFQVGVDGSVDFNIISNALLSPSGSNWIAVFKPGKGDSFVQKWDIPSTPATQDIGDIQV